MGAAGRHRNRAGSGGVIGTEIAATAPHDGYTLMMGNTANIAINAALYKKLTVDTVRDFSPITLVATAPYVMVAPASLGVTNTREFAGACEEQARTTQLRITRHRQRQSSHR